MEFARPVGQCAAISQLKTGLPWWAEAAPVQQRTALAAWIGLTGIRRALLCPNEYSRPSHPGQAKRSSGLNRRTGEGSVGNFWCAAPVAGPGLWRHHADGALLRHARTDGHGPGIMAPAQPDPYRSKPAHDAHVRSSPLSVLACQPGRIGPASGRGFNPSQSAGGFRQTHRNCRRLGGYGPLAQRLINSRCLNVSG